MKKIEIIIQSEQLNSVRTVLEEADITEYYMTDLMKNTSHIDVVKNYRGAKYQVPQLPQIKIETVVADEVAEVLIEKLKNEMTELSSEYENSGKLYMYDVQNAIDIYRMCNCSDRLK